MMLQLLYKVIGGYIKNPTEKKKLTQLFIFSQHDRMLLDSFKSYCIANLCHYFPFHFSKKYIFHWCLIPPLGKKKTGMLKFLVSNDYFSGLWGGTRTRENEREEQGETGY